MLNYIGSYFKSNCVRKLALVSLQEIKQLSDLTVIFKLNANAVLFIIPQGDYSEIFEKLISDIQIYLSELTIYLPVYFTYETEEIFSVYKELKEKYEASLTSKRTEAPNLFDYFDLTEDKLYFSLSISGPRVIKNAKMENIFGFLEVNSQHSTPNPLVAIVAHYDTLGVVGDLPQGVNSNGSGVIAMLELIRILSKFYENYPSIIKYDLLFVFTSAGDVNFEGARHFIDNLEPSISENLQYVLCLDSLASMTKSNEIFMHISRFPKEHEMSTNKLYYIFNSTSKNMGLNLTYVRKKVFLGEEYVPWEHEQFSKKKILAATLSTKRECSGSNFNRTLMVDNRLNKEKLIQNIKFLVESILEFLFDYNISKYPLLQNDDKLIDELHINNLIEYVQRISRSPLNIEKGSKINNDLFNTLNSYTKKAKRQVFELRDIQFYSGNSGTVYIYNVKSKIIDLFLLVGAVLYLIVIFVFVKGCKGTVNEIKSILGRSE